MIYRLTDQLLWQAAQQTGVFSSADLALEGFIHCSERAQILRTANKYFARSAELLLLEIEETRLGVPVIREDLTGSGVFPHVYAAIPLAAVVALHTLTRGDDGAWVLPAALNRE
jgi:uncharacterized protein (DUF952 family)